MHASVNRSGSEARAWARSVAGGDQAAPAAALLPQQLSQLPGVSGPVHAEVLFRAAHGRLSAARHREFARLLRRHRQLLERRSSEVLRTFRDSSGNVKLKLGLSDGSAVETVLLLDRAPGTGTPRRTLCVSSQVGCAMGCTFCRTAGMGFHRNLTSGEIVEQHLAVTERFGRPTNIVFMGMGEPLLNSEAVFEAASVFAHPLGPALPFKRITISTCGIPEGIERLAQASFLDSHRGARPRLAVSLLTAEPALRAELMPGATRAAGSMRPARTTGAAGHRRSAMSSLARALSRYQEKTGRSITIEVPLLGGINDSTNDAAALCAFLDRLPRPDRVDVNLIRWNPVEGLPFHPPLPDAVAAFAGCVIAAGYPVTGRYPRGRSIAAACGQLGTRPRR